MDQLKMKRFRRRLKAEAASGFNLILVRLSP
jgi:hypothetical protein